MKRNSIFLYPVIVQVVDYKVNDVLAFNDCDLALRFIKLKSQELGVYEKYKNENHNDTGFKIQKDNISYELFYLNTIKPSESGKLYCVLSYMKDVDLIDYINVYIDPSDAQLDFNELREEKNRQIKNLELVINKNPILDNGQLNNLSYNYLHKMRGNVNEDFFSFINKTYNYLKTDQSVKRTLWKILNDTKEINDLIFPIIKSGIMVETSLIGGAVRDVVLRNHDKIKDLDVVLSISNQDFFKFIPKKDKMLAIYNFILFENRNIFYKEDIEKLYNYRDQLLKNNNVMSEKDLNNIYINNKNIIIYYIMLVIACSKVIDYAKINLLDNAGWKEVRTQNSIEDDINIYMNTKIKARLGFKLNNYKVDLLLSDDSVGGVVNCFDFNICMAELKLMSGDQRNIFNYKKTSVEDLINSIVLNNFFLDDAVNKKITLNSSRLALAEEIKNSLEFHYLKFKDKYKKYKLNASSLKDVQLAEYERFILKESANKKNKLTTVKSKIKKL